MDEFHNFFIEHQTVITASAITGVTLFALRMWAAGGKCYSKTCLNGKTVIITGANTGIGKETAINLAGRGARVIMACRNKSRGETALSDVRKKTGSKQVVLKMLDLASLESVRTFAEDVKKTESRLDIFVNNAGLMMCPHTKTADGFELQLGTNHLGHFLLTNLLLDKIEGSAPARIINLSSIAHMGTGVTANSVHPGMVITELFRYVSGYNIIWPFMIFLCKTTREGAQTSIYCAVDESIENVTGKYFSDCALKEESKGAQDDEAARRLWDVSVKMVGLDK